MKKSSDNTVFWWIGWITLTILTFFASSYLWTGFIASHVGSMDQKGVPLLWVAAVFGTWMILLVPLIILMYDKVDRAYEDKRILREKVTEGVQRTASGIKFDPMPESERQLTEALTQKIKKMPWTVQKRGNLVTAILKNGKRIPHVFVVDRQEVVGVYGYEKAPFRTADIVDVESADENALPDFKTEGWLRFDS